MLWSLFWINLLGTVYGYQWYWKQLLYTTHEMNLGYLLPFVPDSPTASLFFTIFIWFLIRDRRRGGEAPSAPVGAWRGIVEVFALVTSFKYGIWAVAMIWAAAYQGDAPVWQDWMLTFSHLGMAAEALLYAALYRYRWISIVPVAAWVLLNEAVDYGMGVYPWLPEVLEDDLVSVALFTLGMSVISIGIAVAVRLWNRTGKRPAG
ncbi:DUF1405 domain-containing protein [Paenibacillus caseinilyticus]|nr:DUF1405 domain-containing protein [Paenibacillus caseinilyticus]MCZ8520511.1 DUF1405 domain-containing protein [Paenibacillus caseinilyticus]